MMPTKFQGQNIERNRLGTTPIPHWSTSPLYFPIYILSHFYIQGNKVGFTNIVKRITDAYKTIGSRGQLAQWKTVRFIKFCLARLRFESCLTPSFFHARINSQLYSSKNVDGSRNIAICNTEQLLTRNLWVKGNIDREIGPMTRVLSWLDTRIHHISYYTILLLLLQNKQH